MLWRPDLCHVQSGSAPKPQHFKQSKLYKSPKQPVIYPTQSTISFYHILQYDALKSEKAPLKIGFLHVKSKQSPLFKGLSNKNLQILGL